MKEFNESFVDEKIENNDDQKKEIKEDQNVINPENEEEMYKILG